MAITGILLMVFVFAHMIGNLKMFLGPGEFNSYAESSGDPRPAPAPHGVAVDAAHRADRGLRAAHPLRLLAHPAEPPRPRHQLPVPRRDYVAANFASRTMRWTGVIVGLFVIFHLLDLTWGTGQPRLRPRRRVRQRRRRLERVPVALVYIVANLALGVHLYHGALEPLPVLA